MFHAGKVISGHYRIRHDNDGIRSVDLSERSGGIGQVYGSFCKQLKPSFQVRQIVNNLITIHTAMARGNS